MSPSTRPLPYRWSARPARRSSRIVERALLWLLSWLVGLLALAGTAAWRYEESYTGRVFEGTQVNGVAVGGMTPAQAAATLQADLPLTGDERLTLRVGEQRWVATARELGIHLDAEATAAAAFALGREGDAATRWLTRFALWRGATGAPTVEPRFTRNPAAVQALVARVANEVARAPQDAVLTVQGLSASATPALPGQQLDVAASQERLLAALAVGEQEVELVVTELPPHIVGAEEAATKAQALLAMPLVLGMEQPELRQESGTWVPITEQRAWMVERARLGEMLLVFSRPLDNGQYAWDVRLKPELLRAELQRIAPAIARAPRDARFDFDPATVTLTPTVISQEGLRLDVDGSMAAIEAALAAGAHEVGLVVVRSAPKVATTDAAAMNIQGLAVTGFSDYTGSPDEREVNLSVAAEQYQGVVIPPGGVFSFNEHLGWVVDATGYEEGYIISGNQTQVDVGGGVCQVSTTVFRAAFNAGFEIVERNPHAYRVTYYENGSPTGWDATIFSPYVDLKFRNDTPNYYLMEAENNREANTLTINLYGPPTGRTVTMEARTTETVPHGPPIYTDDPALPAGTTKQVDWEHDGATVVIRRVVRDTATGAELRQDEFWSEYRPWQARFLVGTGGQ